MNKRLTEIVPSDGYYYKTYVGSFGNICELGNNKCTSLVHQKLGQKEDDEMLGIDSHILFKAFKNGKIWTNLFEKIQCCEIISLQHNPLIKGDSYYFLVHIEGEKNNFRLFISSYGETWALTQEELL